MKQVASPVGEELRPHPELAVCVGGLELPNPLIAASGTFGFGQEMRAFYDPSCLGAVVSKGFTLQPKEGNPAPRIAEAPMGLLNSVGLQNPGLDAVLEEELPRARSQGLRLIANVAGAVAEDYVELCRRLDREEGFLAIELNLSCPNVRAGCLSFGLDPEAVCGITKACKAVTTKPIWVKLTPNVQDIRLTARAAQEGGADAVSLVNTFLGLAVDLGRRRPVLRNNYGGYSGPGIKPIALRMVHEVATCLEIPVIGLGGIETADDVLEFIVAGASAVQVGSANLRRPRAMLEILEDLPRRMQHWGIDSLLELRGSLEVWPRD